MPSAFAAGSAAATEFLCSSQGIDAPYEKSCEHVYGMPLGQWKKQHQAKATPEQIARYEASKALHAKHAPDPPAPVVATVTPTDPAEPALTTPDAAGEASRKSKFPMTGVDSALASVLQSCAPLGAEDVPAGETAGRVLRADVAAADALPPFAACAAPPPPPRSPHSALPTPRTPH